MKGSKAEFSVYKVAMDGPRTVVDGRCLESPIRVGDIFDVVYKLTPNGPLDSPDISFSVIDPRSVELLVEEIHYYNQRVDAVDSGYTARLFLSGAGGNLLSDGSVLGSGLNMS